MNTDRRLVLKWGIAGGSLFLPPEHLKKLSDAEKERLFKEELALWERIQEATAPAPLEDYHKLA